MPTRAASRAAWVGLLLTLAACAPSRETVSALAAHHPEALFSVATEDSLVAFTFDDGPDPARTPELLDVLGAHGARATFFLVGERAERHPDVVARIVREGHEIGTHGWRLAPPLLIGATTTGAELDRTAAVLDAFGPVRWYRPGTGLYTTAIREAAEARGYRLALGSVYPNDPYVWSARRQARHVLREVRPGDVVILHDALGWRTRAPDVMRRVLPELERRGYRFVTLSELVAAEADG